MYHLKSHTHTHAHMHAHTQTDTHTHKRTHDMSLSQFIKLPWQKEKKTDIFFPIISIFYIILVCRKKTKTHFSPIHQHILHLTCLQKENKNTHLFPFISIFYTYRQLSLTVTSSQPCVQPWRHGYDKQNASEHRTILNRTE